MYLDDLRLLQENISSLVSAAMSPFGVGAFLIEERVTTQEGGGVIPAGHLVADGEIYEFEAFDSGEGGAPVYISVTERTADPRVFEDGQQRDCRSTGAAALTGERPQEACHLYYGLPTLAGLMKTLLGLDREPQWQTAEVTFINGYSGTVRHKELEECRRVWIDIRSGSMEPVEGTVDLFYADVPFLQYFTSPVSACVQTENGVMDFTVTGFEGTVRAVANLPQDGVSSPSGLPVRMVFDLPK